jgi:hypothetical protein
MQVSMLAVEDVSHIFRVIAVMAAELFALVPANQVIKIGNQQLMKRQFAGVIARTRQLLCACAKCFPYFLCHSVPERGWPGVGANTGRTGERH